MSGFTPGPWIIDRDKNGRSFINGADAFVCHIDKPIGERHDADARLIAASPSMYEARWWKRWRSFARMCTRRQCEPAWKL